MLIKNSFITILLAFLVITTMSAHAELSTTKLKNYVTIEIVNKRTASKSLLPFHDFEYKIALPLEEKSSGEPLNGKISNQPIIVVIHRLDDHNIVADLNISDPAMGQQIIWDGQIIFDKTTNQLKMTTRKKHQRYIIDFKLSPASSENPKFEIDILSL